MNDALGDRMKKNYEGCYKIYIPRRTYTIIRIDGRAFHTYTRKPDGAGEPIRKPYDDRIVDALDHAAIQLCKEAAGAQLAFVQSDEISLLLTDFAKIDTQAWFDGNLQKLISVSASIVTESFNALAAQDGLVPNANFDARLFVVPDPIEVENYFIWRQKDTERNSIGMVAATHASAKQLHGKNQAEQQDLIHNAGDNWNDYPVDFKRGRVILRQPVDDNATRWTVDKNIPIFTQDRTYLKKLIPIQWAEEAVKE